ALSATARDCGDAHAASPAPAWPRGEVGHGLGFGDQLDGPLDANLAAERLPVEGERRTRVEGELRSLATVVVRVEDEAALVERLQQNEANGRPSVRSRRRERCCLGLRDPRRPGVRVPDAELAYRIGVQLEFVHGRAAYRAGASATLAGR